MGFVLFSAASYEMITSLFGQYTYCEVKAEKICVSACEQRRYAEKYREIVNASQMSVFHKHDNGTHKQTTRKLNYKARMTCILV